MKPRASASFCHWPNDTSTPPGHVGPSCVSRPDGRRATTSSAPRAIDGRDDRGLVVQARHVAEADRLAGAELEAEEILERAGQPRAPLVGRHARERRVVHEDRARRRLVHLREQLDQRRLAGAVLADDGDDRAGGQRQRHVVEHEPRRARDRRTTRDRGGCRVRSRAGTGRSADGDERRGVVFEPREAPRAVHPEAAQESDLADRGADVGRQARARREHQQHVAGRRAEARRHEDDRADVARRRTPPTPACATRAEPQRAAATGRVPALPRLAALRHQALADAGDAHFLARRRGRRDGEQVARQPVGLRARVPARRARRRAATSTSARSAARRRRAAPAPGGSTPAAPPSRRAAGSSRSVENSDMYM